MHKNYGVQNITTYAQELWKQHNIGKHKYVR